MTDLLELSSKIIDENITDRQINRINFQLSKLTEDIAMVEAFSHSIVFKTSEGLLVIDTSNEGGGKQVVEAIRGWSKDPFNTLIYTHGHLDHVGGSSSFLADVKESGGSYLRVIAHENMLARFARYELTSGYNMVINMRQFGNLFGGAMNVIGEHDFFSKKIVRPNLTYSESLSFRMGDLDVNLHFGKGETDDHTWAWIPQLKAICAGDFFIWNFPNAGNPQKVQRYPVEWAEVLRKMAGLDAELLLPSHGLPIQGQARIKTVLLEAASALELVVKQTLEMMNSGATLNEIIHAVKVPDEVISKPYLVPRYDDPEFIVNNIWRLYGGWYDGDPANLKPARTDQLAEEYAALAGGAINLAKRAQILAESDELRLACHLVEMAKLSEPDNVEIHQIRADIYDQRRQAESSLMAKGIYGNASTDSQKKVDDSKSV